MNYEASEWEPGDIAYITSRDTPRALRMLIVARGGQWRGQRLWWGPSGYVREPGIGNIERATALTMEELNQRVEVNP